MWGFPNWFALETRHSETYLRGLDSKEHALKSTGLFPCFGALGLTESNTALSQGVLLQGAGWQQLGRKKQFFEGRSRQGNLVPARRQQLPH